MENQKGNKGLVILLTIFVILTLVLGGFVIYDKMFSNNNSDGGNNSNSTNKNTNNNTDNKSENKTYKFEKITTDCTLEKGCTKTYGENTIRIDYLEGMGYDVSINGAYALERIGWPIKEIYVIDNIVVFEAEDRIYALDTNGNIILVINHIDEQIATMKLNPDKPITSNDNKIIASGTRLWHGPSIRVNIGEYKSPCELPDNEVIEGTYELEYLGNKRFQITNTSYNYLKEYEWRTECNTVK